jgi:AraC-like DNA-binding protein
VKGLPASPLLQVLTARPSRGKRSHRANHNHSWMGSLGQVHIQPLARLLPPLVLVKANHAQRLTLHTSLGLLATKWANQRRIRNSSSNLAWQTCRSSRCAERISPRGNTHAIKDGCERCSIPRLGLRSNPCMKTWHRLGRSNHSRRHAACPDQRSLRSSRIWSARRRWRMQKAIALLRDEDKNLFGVAKSVGYDSDAAFNKAFKRVFGVAHKRFTGNVPSVTQG